MTPTRNTSGVGEQCLGCKKNILVANSVKCIVCHRRCHMNCIKPKITEELKMAMQKNDLIAFTCPECNNTLAKHFGKITDDYLGFADRQIMETTTNNRQLVDLQQEISTLGEKLKKVTEERNLVVEQISNLRVNKRARTDTVDEIQDNNMMMVVEIVIQLIEQSNKRTEALIEKSDKRNLEHIKKMNDTIASFEGKLDKITTIVPNQNTKIISEKVEPKVPLKVTPSIPLTQVQFNISKAAPTLKLRTVNTDKQVYDDVILPTFRNDKQLRKLNLIDMAENGNQFLITFKTPEDVTSATNHIREKYGDQIIIEPSKKCMPSIKIVGICSRDLGPEELSEIIIQMNPKFKLDFENFKITEIYNNGFQKNSINAIAQVSIDKFMEIIKDGSILVNMKNCKVYEYL